jgi:hypothetical protein
MILANHVRVLAALGVVLLLHNFVSLNVARPNTPGAATSAAYGLWLENGVLISDIKTRLACRHCNSFNCAHLAQPGW